MATNDATVPAAPTAPAAFLGLLMLDTRFPRPPGDVGNPETYARAGIPARFVTVPGASPRKIVQEADPAFLQPFIDAAVGLARDGAALISTSCGFLARYQDALQAAVPVPVVSSSLLQCRGLARVGIVTFDAASLDRALLDAAGVPANAVVEGLAPGCEMQARILENAPDMDLARVERDADQVRHKREKNVEAGHDERDGLQDRQVGANGRIVAKPSDALQGEYLLDHYGAAQHGAELNA